MTLTKAQERKIYDEGIAQGFSSAEMTGQLDYIRENPEAQERYMGTPAKATTEKATEIDTVAQAMAEFDQQFPDATSDERKEMREAVKADLEDRGMTIDEIADKGIDIVKSGAKKGYATIKKVASAPKTNQAVRSTLDFFGAMGQQAQAQTTRQMRSATPPRGTNIIPQKSNKPFSGMSMIPTLGGGGNKPFQGMSMIPIMGGTRKPFSGMDMLMGRSAPAAKPKKYTRKPKTHTKITTVKKRKYTQVSKKRYVKSKKTQKRK